ncbi:acetyl-CoA carboxylase biotin carboxylase subunit family protein [Streptomyces lateritius]|uniref:ATP-grasp domain-containing protein n=1 Tax=Streptomyces lateritius TaxID=67313 RepID=UPI001C8C8CC2|nr:ATP-grasp domain-containing protein [Streptomyces lateritius]MBX9422353.1 ATP-grasp domain-containing protein [Streptomyces lateritius]
MLNRAAAAANDDRYLLLLGADIPLRERAIVSALRTYPGPVLGMSTHPASPLGNRFFDHVLRGDYCNADQALAVVQEFEKETGLRPDAVVPVIEMTVHVSVAVARHYGLPTLSDECLSLVRDKHTMKLAFERAGVPCARHRTFGTLDELRQAAAELGFPLVLKPRDFAGNVGTVLVPAAEELPDAFDYCRGALLEVAPTYDFSDGRYQAEEFVSAPREVSVEVAHHAGRRVVLAVTDKSKAGAPYFSEMGQLVPSVESDNEALRRVATDACEALLIDRGVAHVEILVDGDRLSVVEVAARPGGDGIMDLVERVYGTSPYDLHIASYHGRADRLPDFPTVPRGIGATAFLKTPPGTVTEVRPLPDTTSRETSLHPTAKAGDRSRSDGSYLARAGLLEYFAPGTGHDPRVVRAEVDELARIRTEQIFTVTGGPDDGGTPR